MVKFLNYYFIEHITVSLGIGSRTCRGYQNTWMLKSHNQHSTSCAPHLWIQTTANHVVLYLLKKIPVQTHVVQGSIVVISKNSLSTNCKILITCMSVSSV